MRAGAETGIRRHIVTEQHEHLVLGSMMPHEGLDGRDRTAPRSQPHEASMTVPRLSKYQ
jgi:hypothetical protein